MVDFVDSLGNTHSTALARVTNICEFVTTLLDQHKKDDISTWHDSYISHDEIWIKFGGDHGKDSLKFTMQVANTQRPNSKNNTFVVAMAKIKDNYENLKICMSISQTQLEELSNLKWNGKKIVLFLFW